MENKIPTAEELYNQFPHTVVGYISKGNCLAIAQTLAKLHVKNFENLLLESKINAEKYLELHVK